MTKFLTISLYLTKLSVTYTAKSAQTFLTVHGQLKDSTLSQITGLQQPAHHPHKEVYLWYMGYHLAFGAELRNDFKILEPGSVKIVLVNKKKPEPLSFLFQIRSTLFLMRTEVKSIYVLRSNLPTYDMCRLCNVQGSTNPILPILTLVLNQC